MGKKRGIALLLATMMTVGIFAGCGSSSDTTESTTKDGKTKLVMMVNSGQTHVTTAAIEEMAQDYMDQNQDIEIEIQPVSSDYEATMKTRMAANDLPDIFATHGWSSTRYSEFAEPLSDQAWAANVNPIIKDNITAANGNIYALPMDADVAGIIFNKTVLDEAGVDPLAITTWQEFSDACAKIKAIGKTPISAGGPKDNWTFGNIIDWMATPFLITDSAHDYSTSLLDGTFDWNNFKPLIETVNTWYTEGYFNSDIKEGSYLGAVDLFASNDAGFGFFTSEAIQQILKTNPDAVMGYIPIPAYYEGDDPTVIVGERVAYAVWKDSPRKEEALKFIDFLAQPENVNKMSTTTGNPTGIVGEGYSSELGNLQEYYENVQDLRSFGYFDRAYLPSGMWDSLIKMVEAIINQDENADEITQKLSDDYTKLYGQQSE